MNVLRWIRHEWRYYRFYNFDGAELLGVAVSVLAILAVIGWVLIGVIW